MPSYNNPHAPQQGITLESLLNQSFPHLLCFQWILPDHHPHRHQDHFRYRYTGPGLALVVEEVAIRADDGGGGE